MNAYLLNKSFLDKFKHPFQPIIPKNLKHFQFKKNRKVSFWEVIDRMFLLILLGMF